jgi:pimeloyl-ACP methyl ester carboxylesterase
MMRTIMNGDVGLATQTFGAPADPPLVLAMGATASMLWWPEELCEGLAARGYYVIRYDHRDTGQSTTTAPGQPTYSVEDMATDLIAIMDGLDLESAHVVGMSLGGLIGQIAALTWPGRIRSLTLLGAEPLGWTGQELPGIAPEFLEHFASFSTLDWSDQDAVTAFMLEIARMSAGGQSFDAARERRRIEAEIDRAVDIRSAFNHGMVGLQDDWSGRAADINQPVLVLHGSDDPILPRQNGEALALTIRGSRLVVLEGIGHELPATALPRMIDEIGSFLDNVE